MRFSPEIIAKAKEYCLYAYDGSKILPEEKLESSSGIQGFFKYEELVLTICFFGSNEPKDWLLNLNFFSENNYHKGIAKGYMSIRKQLWSKVFDLDTKDPNFRKKAKIKGYIQDGMRINLQVIGYSLGGAIALLAALELSNFGFKVNLITFGQPKIIKRLPKINRIKSYVRVVNPLDLVTHVPWWFTHLSGEVIYKIWVGNPHDLRRY